MKDRRERNGNKNAWKTKKKMNKRKENREKR